MLLYKDFIEKIWDVCDEKYPNYIHEIMYEQYADWVGLVGVDEDEDELAITYILKIFDHTQFEGYKELT